MNILVIMFVFCHLKMSYTKKVAFECVFVQLFVQKNEFSSYRTVKEQRRKR